jgi:hypothetical protein
MCQSDADFLSRHAHLQMTEFVSSLFDTCHSFDYLCNTLQRAIYQIQSTNEGPAKMASGSE